MDVSSWSQHQRSTAATNVHNFMAMNSLNTMEWIRVKKKHNGKLHWNSHYVANERNCSDKMKRTRKSFDIHGRKTSQNDVLTLERFWTHSVFHRILKSRRKHPRKLWNNSSFDNFTPPKLWLLPCCAQFKPTTASTFFHYVQVHHYSVARRSNDHMFLRSFHSKQFFTWYLFFNRPLLSRFKIGKNKF